MTFVLDLWYIFNGVPTGLWHVVLRVAPRVQIDDVVYRKIAISRVSECVMRPLVGALSSFGKFQARVGLPTPEQPQILGFSREDASVARRSWPQVEWNS